MIPPCTATALTTFFSSRQDRTVDDVSNPWKRQTAWSKMR